MLYKSTTTTNYLKKVKKFANILILGLPCAKKAVYFACPLPTLGSRAASNIKTSSR